MTGQEALDPLAAALQLWAAVDQLTQPAAVELQRDIPMPGTDAWQLLADDNAFERDLWTGLEEAVAARDRRGVVNGIGELDRLQLRREARTATAAPIPPLLHQLQDAIGGSGNTDHGAGSAGASRSPLALAALDLVTEIADTIGARTGAGSTALTAQVRAWTDRVCIDETQVVAAAEKAVGWPDRGRAILDPPKRWTTPGACPECGAHTAYVEEAGERVRRPAIELDRENARARCLVCPEGRWQGETELRQLAKVLEDAP